MIFSVLTNITNDEQFYKSGNIVGFFQPVPEEDIVEHGLPEARIDESFQIFLENLKTLFLELACRSYLMRTGNSSKIT